MIPERDQPLSQALTALLGVMESNWLWPSPETGFARHVFAAAGEVVPVSKDDGGVWPDARRLDQAPVLAAAGYLLSVRAQGVRPEQHQEWSEGMNLLRGRNAFSSIHLSFAYRPLDVLGVALGVVNCTAADRPQAEWLRGVIARLRGEQVSDDPWSDLLYGIAAATVGETWRKRLYFSLSDAEVDVLALLRWLVRTAPEAAHGKLSGQEQIDAEMLRRFRNNPIPRDVARAAILYQSLSQADAERLRHFESSVSDRNRSQHDLRKHVIQLDVTPRTLNNMPAGMSMNFSLYEGDSHMGDKISIGGNVSGSAIGTGASAVVGDITAFQSMVDNSTRLTPDLKTKLKEAREVVEKSSLGESDKKDVLDDLGKLTDELEKPAPEPGRVARFFSRIKEIAPTVASVLSSTAAIAKVIGQATGHS